MTMKDEWLVHKFEVLPEGANKIFKQVMRDAFYAGALKGTLHILEIFQDEEIDEAATELAIQKHCDEIGDFVAKRRKQLDHQEHQTKIKKVDASIIGIDGKKLN